MRAWGQAEQSSVPTILARPEVGRRMIDKDKTSGRTPCVSESKNGHLFARSGREPYTGCARRDLYSSWRLARKQSALRRGSDIRIRVSRTSFRFRTRASFWGRRLGAYAMRHVFVAVLSAGSICAFACACHPAAAADTPFYATVTVTPVVGAPPWAPGIAAAPVVGVPPWAPAVEPVPVVGAPPWAPPAIESARVVGAPPWVPSSP